MDADAKPDTRACQDPRLEYLSVSFVNKYTVSFTYPLYAYAMMVFIARHRASGGALGACILLWRSCSAALVTKRSLAMRCTLIWPCPLSFYST